MTEKEAISIIKGMRPGCGEKPIYPEGELCEAYDMAIQALEEIQQYREIGTVEELKNAKMYIDLAKKHGTVGKAIDTCAEYEFIGTVDECHAAVEEQKPKKPDYEGNGYDDKGELIYDTWICPCCRKRYEVDYDDYEHCLKCGQAVDRSEEG